VSAVARRYLDDIFAAEPKPDTLVLGCTHFPVLAATLREVIGDVAIVDSAQTTASALGEILRTKGLARSENLKPELRLLATDGCERFARVGASFLGETINDGDVELVDLS
jgi:glutamate racemase